MKLFSASVLPRDEENRIASAVKHFQPNLVFRCSAADHNCRESP